MAKVVDKMEQADIRVRAEEAVLDRGLEIFSLFVHDLESPLASTKYLLQLLESGRFEPGKLTHQRLVRSSRIALERAESILYDIMAVARAGQVGLPVEMTNLVPTAIIEEAIELVSGSTEECGVAVSFTNNSGDVAVKADPKLLKRVLDNLLYNALRHTPTGGQIAVYTEPGKKCLFIHVKDSGPGLGEIDPETLFEKYGQAETRARGKHRGVGLGLYFCRLAAAGMGGTVLADDHPKGGAVFSIKLQKNEG
jgi:signal transduction histidine kinase